VELGCPCFTPSHACPAPPPHAPLLLEQVVDFQWNPADAWTLLSVADEAGEGGGGTLQLWRVSDLVFRPEDEVVAELEQYK